MRVTLDFDNKNFLKVQRAITYLLDFGADYTKITVKPSPTNKGFHIIARGLPISQEQSMQIREQLGDDPNRIAMDKQTTKKPKQVLWATKKFTRHVKTFPQVWSEKYENLLL